MSNGDLDIRIHADFNPQPTSSGGTPPPLFNGQPPPGVGGTSPSGGNTPPPLFNGSIPPPPLGAPPGGVTGAGGAAESPAIVEAAEVTGAVAAAGAVLGPLDVALVALTVAVEAAVVAFDFIYDTAIKLDDAFQDIAQSTKRFNPNIATTTALGDVKLLLAEMRRSNAIQEEISDYMDTRSDLAVEIRDLYTAIIKDLIPPVTVIVAVAKEVVTILKNNYEALKSGTLAVLEVATHVAGIGLAAAAIKAILAKTYQEILDARKLLRKNRVAEQIQELEDFANPKVQGNALGRNLTLPVAARMFGR